MSETAGYALRGRPHWTTRLRARYLLDNRSRPSRTDPLTIGRRDSFGYVFNAPLTVNLIVHDNIAVTTIPRRASCDRPATVTLYGENDQVLSHTGNTRKLNSITRPVKRQNPFAYKTLFFHRPQDATGKR
jgi:hypothetical protein